MTKVLTDRDTGDEHAPEHRKVIDWRLKWLVLDGGYSAPLAERIAKDMSIDYRYAIKLRKDCPDEKLVKRILFGGPRT